MTWKNTPFRCFHDRLPGAARTVLQPDSVHIFGARGTTVSRSLLTIKEPLLVRKRFEIVISKAGTGISRSLLVRKTSLLIRKRFEIVISRFETGISVSLLTRKTFLLTISRFEIVISETETGISRSDLAISSLGTGRNTEKNSFFYRQIDDLP